MGFFKSNPLEKIEKKDEKHEARLEKTMRHILESLNAFKRILKMEDIEEKDTALTELHDSLGAALQDILTLIEDERTIEDVENSEKKYAIPDDDLLLQDKTRRLVHLKEVLSALVDILDENPNLSEYQGEYLDVVNQDVKEVEESFAKILEDDHALAAIYKKLS